MERIIKTVSENYKDATLDFIEKVFTDWENAEEGKLVRSLVEEIRSKKYYVPELELIEYGLQKAKELGYQAVLVEGNPQNYRSRGFKTSADFGIYASEKIQLPHVDCMMIQELVPGALEKMHGYVDYDFYEVLAW